jgi:hypothetical protein
MHFLALLAQQKPAGSPFDRPELLWGSAGLAGALLVGAVVIYLVDKWRKQTALADRQTGLELTDFRAMFESGEITKAEYDRLRLKVAERVKQAEAATVADASARTAVAAPPAVAAPFPPGYFDDPTTSPPASPPPPGGTAPPA